MRYLSPPLTHAERMALVREARTYMGVRWRHQGRDRRGLDCGGLVVAALADIGRHVRDSAAYGRVPYRGSLEAVLADNFGDPLPSDQMQLGDVALMRFRGAPSHVGIIGDYPYGGFSLIHAFAQNRMVVEHRLDKQWSDSIAQIYRP